MYFSIKLLFKSFPKPLGLRLVYFIKNTYYGSWWKLRKFENHDRNLNPEDSGVWAAFQDHFDFIANYYPARNILRSPMVRNTMYACCAIKHPIKNKNIKNATVNLAKSIDLSFKMDLGSSFGWLSTFGAILEKAEEILPGILENMYRRQFVEFGPGLGFAGQLYSSMFDAKGIYYDLPVVSNVRGICLHELAKEYAVNKPEEYVDVDKLKNKIATLKEYSFISTWAFTESPKEIREKFEIIIKNSQVCLIVSNPKFGELNNFEYLDELSKRISKKHIKTDFSFLVNAPEFQKRHELHIFVNY